MLRSIKELFRGLHSYIRAHRVISEHKLWTYVAIPGFMSFCYILLLIFVGRVYFTEISDYITRHWIPASIKGEVTVAITTVLLWILVLMVGYITYKQIILIFLSPILSYLSELTETVVYNEPAPEFRFGNLVRDIVRGLIINLRNLFLTLILMMTAWVTMLIPGLGPPVSTGLMLLIQFFYDGSGLVDYTLERKRYSVRESIHFVKANRARVIGIGMGFMLILVIPLAGWFAAPSYGTVAATLATLDKIREENDSRS
jgi:CysZ protein